MEAQIPTLLRVYYVFFFLVLGPKTLPSVPFRRRSGRCREALKEAEFLASPSSSRESLKSVPGTTEGEKKKKTEIPPRNTRVFNKALEVSVKATVDYLS